MFWRFSQNNTLKRVCVLINLHRLYTLSFSIGTKRFRKKKKKKPVRQLFHCLYRLIYSQTNGFVWPGYVYRVRRYNRIRLYTRNIQARSRQCQNVVQMVAELRHYQVGPQTITPSKYIEEQKQCDPVSQQPVADMLS